MNTLSGSDFGISYIYIPHPKMLLAYEAIQFAIRLLQRGVPNDEIPRVPFDLTVSHAERVDTLPFLVFPDEPLSAGRANGDFSEQAIVDATQSAIAFLFARYIQAGIRFPETGELPWGVLINVYRETVRDDFNLSGMGWYRPITTAIIYAAFPSPKSTFWNNFNNYEKSQSFPPNTVFDIAARIPAGQQTP